ncbi:MAG: hypothetical protein LBT86_09430 [Deltaproteobacteria bacterium]|nr:hypothetical protein [Deltaproteobacteria bacterium]
MSKTTHKKFNLAGPCDPANHYTIPVLRRLPVIEEMIEAKNYFIMRAPDKSGKTTFINALTDKINADGHFYAIACSLVSLRSVKLKSEVATAIVAALNQSMAASKVDVIKLKAFAFDSASGMLSPERKIRNCLKYLCEDLDKELVVFFEESDSLSGAGLMTFLSQLKEGHASRQRPGKKFPRSIGLVGVRSVHDLGDPNEAGKDVIGPREMFNISKATVTYPNFTREEIRSLLQKYTIDTGQQVSVQAIDRVWFWTEGQPWLVNALANETVAKILNNDYEQLVNSSHIDLAAKAFFPRRETNIHNLLERLIEPRTRRIMEPFIVGASWKKQATKADIQYALDMGFMKREGRTYLPTNPMSAEIIFGTLAGHLFETVANQICANDS